VLRSQAQSLTDNDLLAKLRSLGIELDRPSLERLCRQALSAEEIATPWIDQRTFHGRPAEMESDWIWVCLTALWQRWLPDQPGFELLDDKMQAGYDLLGAKGAVAACRIWLEAWRDVLGLLDKGGLLSIRAFDERFRGSQSLFNWIQDLEDELWNAGLEDRQFLTARIVVCEEGLRRFPLEDDLMTENRRRALAESYFELGETTQAEALYRDWLHSDPRWGWGWIGWSDGYGFTRTQLRDWQRAEQILREGLAVDQVRDRLDMLERLADVCAEQGRKGEANELRKEAKRSVAAARVTRPKIGRNEPCPCGSGEEVQEMLRHLKHVVPPESHTAANRFPTDPPTPRKLNLKKPALEDGINRGGLQDREYVGGILSSEIHKSGSGRRLIARNAITRCATAPSAARPCGVEDPTHA
jgi:tetratricopeptide (TPR) repeat protein